MTHELLDSKIRTLLSMHCHVPASKHDACIRDLSDQIRGHMTGKFDGIFSKSALLGVCATHGGSVLPTRTMDHYVRPKNFDAILQMLDQQFAVIIAGPSGNGKSLTADVIGAPITNLWSLPTASFMQNLAPRPYEQNFNVPIPFFFICVILGAAIVSHHKLKVGARNCRSFFRKQMPATSS